MPDLKITIIGNSVALRTRPVQPHPNNRNYGTVLKDILDNKLNYPNININNKGYGAFTIFNACKHIEEYIQTFPHYFIINLGVVDASTREIPLWFYRLANKKKKNVITTLIEYIYRVVIIKFRPLLVKIRLKRSWVSKGAYQKYFKYLIETLIKETNAKIIVLSINEANERVEKALPGSRKNHKEFNEIMKGITLNSSQEFLDLSYLDSGKHYPDGVHYSYEGHKIVAKEISNIILKSHIG